MDKQQYRDALSRIIDATNGEHRMIIQLQKQLQKPWITPYWLEKINAILKTVSPAEVFEKESESHLSTIEATGDPVVILQKTDPQEIIDLKNQAKILHKEESKIYYTLCSSRSEAKRYEYAGQIIGIGVKLDDIYDQIRNYNTSGNLPVSLKKIENLEDINTLHNQKNSIASRLSRIKQKLANCKDLNVISKLENERTVKLKYLEEINNKINGKGLR